jgi:hypothetical protein
MFATDSQRIEFPAQERLFDLRRFYALMDDLARRFGGPRCLQDCAGRMVWPLRGVYFFYEPGEVRRESGDALRIVRVGTHALKSGSQTTLWTRLAQHKGQQNSGGGNHRGSIFRLLVGAALMDEQTEPCPTWGQGTTASRDIRDGERAMERRVSAVIGRMPFLAFRLDDGPGPESLRGFIERNAIALLSNAGKQPLDPPSKDWLGHSCPRERVRASGLWNQNHVDEDYEPSFLDVLGDLIRILGPRA